MSKIEYTSLEDYHEYPPAEMLSRAQEFYQDIKRRRTVRDFSSRPIPRALIENCLKAAGTAPSGANRQPWHFVVITDTEIKKQIRQAAEEVEREFYQEGAPDYWLEDLEHLGTGPSKPHLEEAPCLIVVFAQSYGVDKQGDRLHHYYISESVGIAMGILITAVHNAGLVSLTHTPKPMNFLRRTLKRPKQETPVLILAVGYPKDTAQVPKLTRKALTEIATFFE